MTRLRELTHLLKGEPALDREASARILDALGVSPPADYVEFVGWSNGGVGKIPPAGYVDLWAVDRLAAFNEEYSASGLDRSFVLFGTDGGAEALAFDTRTTPNDIVMLPFPALDAEDAEPIGGTLVAALEFLSR